MSARKSIRTVAGLQRSPNLLGVPPGALKVADNCVVRVPNLLEMRRGQAPLSYNLSTASRRIPVITSNVVRMFPCDESSATAALADVVGAPPLPLVGANITAGTGQIGGSRVWPTGSACFDNFGAPYANDFTALHTGTGVSVGGWINPRSSDWDHMQSGNPNDDYARVVLTASHGLGTVDYFSGCLIHLEVKRATSDGRNARTVRALYEYGTPGSKTVNPWDTVSSLAFGTWTHVIATFDYATGVAKFYINSALDSTTTGMLAPSLGLTDVSIAVGCHPQLLVHFFKGQLDTIGVWNKALSATEVLDAYNRGIGTISPVVINELTHFNGNVIAHVNNDILARDTGSAWSGYSDSYVPPVPTELRMKFARAQQRLYFTTNSGVMRLESSAGTPVPAGITRPRLDTNGTHVVYDSTGFIAKDSAQAYRATIGHIDANRKGIESAPSGRCVVRIPPDNNIQVGNCVRAANVVTVTTDDPHGLKPGDIIFYNPAMVGFASSATVVTVPTSLTYTYAEAGANGANVGAGAIQWGDFNRIDLAIAIPSTATAGDVLRVWRTRSFTTPSGGAAGDGAATEPGEDTFLAWEHVIASGELGTTVTFADRTPNVMLGRPAYFATSQETLSGANERPPLSRDIATFDNALWFANVTTRRQTQVLILATGGSVGIALGDVITVALGGLSFTLTAVSDATAHGTAGKFLLYQGGDVATDNELTAMSIVSAINTAAANTFCQAFYASSVLDNPGKVLIQETGVGSTSTLDISVSAHGLGYVPQLPVTGAGVFSSLAFNYANRVYKSKTEEPDAVPDTNFYPVGEPDDPILRIVSAADVLWVLKQRSIWSITPAGDGSYTVALFSSDYRLLGNDTPAVLGHQVLCFSNRGPIAISQSGIAELGMPLEYDFAALMGYDNSNFLMLPTLARYAFGLSYASERQYLLALPSVSTDTYAASVYVYNTAGMGAGATIAVLGQAAVWTKWTLSRTCGVVEPTTDLLYMGDASVTAVTTVKERKQFRAADYKDGTATVTITSLTTNSDGTVTFHFTGSYPALGALVEQTGSYSPNLKRGIVKSIDQSAGTFTIWPYTLTAPDAWTAAAATVYAPITVTITWLEEALDAPGVLKALEAINLHFQSGGFYASALSIVTDIVLGGTVKSLACPSYIPLVGAEGTYGPRDDFTPGLDLGDAARGTYFSLTLAIQEAEARFKLAGLSLDYSVDGSRTERG